MFLLYSAVSGEYGVKERSEFPQLFELRTARSREKIFSRNVSTSDHKLISLSSVNNWGRDKRSKREGGIFSNKIYFKILDICQLSCLSPSIVPDPRHLLLLRGVICNANLVRTRAGAEGDQLTLFSPPEYRQIY